MQMLGKPGPPAGESESRRVPDWVLFPATASELLHPPGSSAYQVPSRGRWGAGGATWSRATGSPHYDPTYTCTHTHTHMLLPPLYNLVPTHPHNATFYSRHTPQSYIYPCTLLYTYSGSLPYAHLHRPPPHPHAQVSTFTLYSTHSLQLNIPPPPIHTLIPPPQSLYPHPPQHQHPTLCTPLHTTSSSAPTHASCPHPSSPDSLIPYPT